MARSNKNRGRKPSSRRGRSQPAKSPSPDKPDGKLRKLFSSLAWQGITGFLTLLAIGVTIGLFFYAQHIQNYAQSIQEQSTVANIALTTTYEYNGSDKWTMNMAVLNHGPAVASVVHLGYSAAHVFCSVEEIVPGKPAKVDTRGFKGDLGCSYGSALTSVTPAKPTAGVFIHPLTSYSVSPSAIGLFSGTAYSLYPGESIWIDFKFTVTSDLNRELIAALTSALRTPELKSPSKLGTLFTHFNQVTVTGDNIKLTSAYSAENLAFRI